MLPDETLARRFKRTVISVTCHRGALHIHVFAPKQHPWTRAEVKLLGTLTDKVLAAKLGASLTLSSRKTPLKTPLFLNATRISPNVCKGLTDKK